MSLCLNLEVRYEGGGGHVNDASFLTLSASMATTLMTDRQRKYRQISNIRRTKSQNLDVSRLVSLSQSIEVMC